MTWWLALLTSNPDSIQRIDKNTFFHIIAQKDQNDYSIANIQMNQYNEINTGICAGLNPDQSISFFSARSGQMSQGWNLSINTPDLETWLNFLDGSNMNGLQNVEKSELWMDQKVQSFVNEYDSLYSDFYEEL